MSELELTVSRRIPVPREKIFNAWLSPAMLARFMRPGEGMTVPKAETDPVKGGRFLVLMGMGDKEIPHEGTYLEIDPYSRIVFTWESPYSVDDSVVTIDLTEIDSRTTEVKLQHVKFASEESRNNHEGGWTAVLAKLEETLAG